ncbi:hypothetical protein [Saccharopolyspora flava]|uniref:hypothetical protein n=1 Tax=Saccharopolyspora flava TaxID=95161 RepID=UPI0011148884|nr:hypothetical protein [Saccharopolyspora flava]
MTSLMRSVVIGPRPDQVKNPQRSDAASPLWSNAQDLRTGRDAFRERVKNAFPLLWKTERTTALSGGLVSGLKIENGVGSPQ